MLQSPSNRKLNKYLNSESIYNKKGVMVPMSFKTVPLTTSRPANVTPDISPPAYRGTHGEKHIFVVRLRLTPTDRQGMYRMMNFAIRSDTG